MLTCELILLCIIQCSNGLGACPDTLDSSGSCTNDAYNVSGSITDGVQCVSFTRNLTTGNDACAENYAQMCCCISLIINR